MTLKYYPCPDLNPLLGGTSAPINWATESGHENVFRFIQNRNFDVLQFFIFNFGYTFVKRLALRSTFVSTIWLELNSPLFWVFWKNLTTMTRSTEVQMRFCRFWTPYRGWRPFCVKRRSQSRVHTTHSRTRTLEIRWELVFTWRELFSLLWPNVGNLTSHSP